MFVASFQKRLLCVYGWVWKMVPPPYGIMRRIHDLCAFSWKEYQTTPASQTCVWCTDLDTALCNRWELLPEFFMPSPTFLLPQEHGSNHSIVLPPWAQGNVETFIQLHRQALESDFVSSQLHHWIDFVFGVNQNPAVARNHGHLFYPEYYPDNRSLLDRDLIWTHDQVRAVIERGIAPLQLFRTPHPRRMTMDEALEARYSSGILSCVSKDACMHISIYLHVTIVCRYLVYIIYDRGSEISPCETVHRKINAYLSFLVYMAQQDAVNASLPCAFYQWERRQMVNFDTEVTVMSQVLILRVSFSLDSYHSFSSWCEWDLHSIHAVVSILNWNVICFKNRSFSCVESLKRQQSTTRR